MLVNKLKDPQRILSFVSSAVCGVNRRNVLRFHNVAAEVSDVLLKNMATISKCIWGAGGTKLEGHFVDRKQRYSTYGPPSLFKGRSIALRNLMF
ncbi:hypothetical protein TNCV_3840851 [Trichonephila clavipes]|nr:hypothetical protein TNCV_3840851 [Trichonephila clavipes]